MKQEWIDRPEAGSAFGYRLFSTFAMLCGRTAARLILYPITVFYLFKRGPERRAARKYLQLVLGRKATLLDAAKQIHCFASVTLDRVFLLSESFKRFEVKVFGLDELRQQWAKKQGVLIFGSHLGSFDALRVLAQFRSDVKFRVVLDVEQNPTLTRLLNAFNPELANSIINARQDGAVTALAIKEALDETALVTLLVDRARPGNQVVIADFLGRPAPFPTGPWQTRGGAQGAGGAVLRPVSRRQSLRPAFRGVRRNPARWNAATRQASLNAIIQRFADRLAHYARTAPYNWFNFYDFWQLNTPPSADGILALLLAPAESDGARSPLSRTRTP